MLQQINEADPRVKRTRQLLLQAFMTLLKEKSLYAISVQDIAKQATVNRATFYAHFEDKYALMDSWIREEFQQVVLRKLPTASTLSESTLYVLVQAIFDFLALFHSQCKPSDRQFDPLFETALQQELYVVLLNWLKQASPTAGPQRRKALETTAQVISWAIFGPAAQWSRGSKTPSAQEMVLEVMPVVISGLAGIIGPLPAS